MFLLDRDTDPSSAGVMAFRSLPYMCQYQPTVPIAKTVAAEAVAVFFQASAACSVEELEEDAR